MPEIWKMEDFTPHLRSRFEVEGGNGYFLELASATDHSNARLEQFSLLFTGSSSPWLTQRVYTLIHAQMGRLEMFLVPIGPEGASMRYEAVFSRFVAP